MTYLGSGVRLSTLRLMNRIQALYRFMRQDFLEILYLRERFWLGTPETS